MPGGCGGFGLRSAERTAPPAYLASLLDALPALAAKLPEVADDMVTELRLAGSSAVASVREASTIRERLLDIGAVGLPSWEEALRGAEPPPLDDSDDDDPGFRRGWQRFACSFVEKVFQEQVVLQSSDPARRALLLSQSGAFGAAWLRAIPSEPALTLEPLRFQIAMRRRLRWSLPIGASRCRGGTCRALLDDLGDHLASCNRSGLLKSRSRPIERMLARILREAGARVRENMLLSAAGGDVDPGDGRRI